MASPRSLFQTVVDKNAPREHRREAVTELGQIGAVTQLRTITRNNGLNGALRREAVTGLRSIGGADALETIAADRTVDSAIRTQATR